MPKPRVDQDAAFLNIPYDNRFERLYLAYIVGLVELGLTPRATLAIPGGAARLDRIFALIQSCRYSVHDLSRVELDRTPPPTPRFNMPLELGLAIAWEKLHPARHIWFVCETVNRRAQKSISDLNGTDFNIHDGSPEGVMRELRNAFVRRKNQPDVPRMMRTYNSLRALLPALRRSSASKSYSNPAPSTRSLRSPLGYGTGHSLIRTNRERLKSLGWDRKQIIFERYD